MKEYDSITVNGDIPKTLKIAMLFIDRVGFPILAFCLMFWMSYTSLDKVTEALTSNTKALTEFSASSQEFQKNVTMDHKYMLDKLGFLHQ